MSQARVGAERRRCRYSRNLDVVAAVSRVSVFTVPCHATQLALADVLSDVEFTREFLAASAAALRGAWSAVEQTLQECAFKFFEPSAGVFVLVCPAASAFDALICVILPLNLLCSCVDLSPYLSSPTWDGERQLFVKLFDRARVLITPGKDLHFAQPGWFRICFAM